MLACQLLIGFCHVYTLPFIRAGSTRFASRAQSMLSPKLNDINRLHPVRLSPVRRGAGGTSSELTVVREKSSLTESGYEPILSWRIGINSAGFALFLWTPRRLRV